LRTAILRLPLPLPPAPAWAQSQEHHQTWTKTSQWNDALCRDMVAGSIDNAEPHKRQLTEHHLYTQTPIEHCRPYNTSTITLHVHSARAQTQQQQQQLQLLLLLLHPSNGLFSRTACVSRYQERKTSLDLNDARDNGVLRWQWHQLHLPEMVATGRIPAAVHTFVFTRNQITFLLTTVRSANVPQVILPWGCKL